MVALDWWFRCNAIAPPARKLWELIWSGWNPYCHRSSCMTAALIGELMSAARSTLPDVFCVKYVLIIVCPAEVLLEMWCNLMMSAFTGNVLPCFASWWTDWFRFPFFGYRCSLSLRCIGLTGFLLWRRYRRQLWGHFFKGAFLPQKWDVQALSRTRAFLLT
jgi:hypothetical protein